ncbi:hypothetical protein ACFYO2_11740 [Streptomyces sp. NPDC006602]|uniref:hypothetical protein n=1 Tax=Streptomyces sp. NPDC006602 TaxID=3364751 RepID=UPI003687A893
MSGSGGARYWNEETQRWQDDDGTRPNLPAPATPPPPARPGDAPVWPTGVPAPDVTGGPAMGTAAVAGGPAADPAPQDPAPSPAQAPGQAQAPVPVPAQAPASDLPGVWPAIQWPSDAWPPADQTVPAAAGPGRGMSRRLVWSVLVGAAAVGVAVSLVLTLVVGSGDDEDGPTVAASGSPTSAGEVSQQSDPSASPTEESASPTVSALELPAGYEEQDDTEGFRIAIPEGWSRTTADSQYGMAVVNYRSGDGEHRLQIYQVSEESPDASFELYLSDQTAKPDGFEQLSLENLDGGEFTGSRLEYLADSIKGEPDVGTWHVYDERFVASDGDIYAIAAYGPDADGRDDELEVLTTALEWFCPPLGQCAPASSSFDID